MQRTCLKKTLLVSDPIICHSYRGIPMLFSSWNFALVGWFKAVSRNLSPLSGKRHLFPWCFELCYSCLWKSVAGRLEWGRLNAIVRMSAKYACRHSVMWGISIHYSAVSYFCFLLIEHTHQNKFWVSDLEIGRLSSANRIYAKIPVIWHLSLLWFESNCSEERRRPEMPLQCKYVYLIIQLAMLDYRSVIL